MGGREEEEKQTERRRGEEIAEGLPEGGETLSCRTIPPNLHQVAASGRNIQGESEEEEEEEAMQRKYICWQN